MTPNPDPVSSVDDLIVAPEPTLANAAHAPATEAFLALSQTLARSPELAIQRLAESAMKLAAGESAGVSLEDTDEGRPVFRWIAVAGQLAPYANGTMPRTSSPCGDVVDRGRALIMRDPGRYYASVADLDPPVRTALLVPFARAGRFVGTVWVVAHSQPRAFSAEDVRVVQNLTTFVNAILDTLQFRGGPAK